MLRLTGHCVFLETRLWMSSRFAVLRGVPADVSLRSERHRRDLEWYHKTDAGFAPKWIAQESNWLWCCIRACGNMLTARNGVCICVGKLPHLSFSPSLLSHPLLATLKQRELQQQQQQKVGNKTQTARKSLLVIYLHMSSMQNGSHPIHKHTLNTQTHTHTHTRTHPDRQTWGCNGTWWVASKLAPAPDC